MLDPLRIPAGVLSKACEVRIHGATASMGVGDSLLAVLRRRPFSAVQARYAALCVLNKVRCDAMRCDPKTLTLSSPLSFFSHLFLPTIPALACTYTILSLLCCLSSI